MTITGNDKTKPNVGVIPLWNPAYTGRNKPKTTYKPVTIRANQTPSLPLREYSVFCEKAGRQAQTVKMAMVMRFFMLFWVCLK